MWTIILQLMALANELGRQRGLGPFQIVIRNRELRNEVRESAANLTEEEVSRVITELRRTQRQGAV